MLRLAIGALLVLAAGAMAGGAAAQARPIASADLRSGTFFLSPELAAMQADDFANPGMLWVERGGRLWREAAGTGGKSCADCHGDAAKSMRGVAARHPAFDAGAGALVNVEGRINQCRARQGAAPLAPESEELLALSAFVAYQSRGVPVAVSVDGPARRHFDAGRAAYYERRGQMNLSCAHCHDRNWDRTLLNEAIGQGHGNAYPVYRLEWQTAGSLHRRFRACNFGVRAAMLPVGAPAYLDLELFLAWRGEGLRIETPGVRR